jgi:hypothetical protein
MADFGTKYFEDSFFRISNPSAVIMAIQFRTQHSESDISNSSHWQEITMNPNNYFDSATITDNGGMQKIELNLFDHNMSNLENLISKALIVSRLSNVAAGEKQSNIKDGLFTVKLDTTSSANIRIRFGYSEVEEDYLIQDTKFEGAYKDRTKGEKTVAMSPWIYLQIIGVNFKVVPAGLQASISAFSVTGSFIDRVKILKKFAVIRGTPQSILDATKNLCLEASDNALDLEILDPPDIPANLDGEYFIEINLGSKSSDSGQYWMTVRNFLDSFKDKIPPRKYKSDGSIIPTGSDGDAEETSGEDTVQELGYDYMIVNDDSGGKIKTKILFYYPKPESQQHLRTYIWKDYANSIIKSFEVDSQLDFANLNRQIFVYDKNKNSAEVFLAKPQGANTEEEVQNNKLGTMEQVTENLNSDNFRIAFVSDVVQTSSGSVNNSAIQSRVAQQIVKYINQGVYKGSITIPLDPFFLFDNELRRYQYVIRIVVKRPSYFEDGTLVEGTLSYLTGNYLISDITHTINASGGETKLGLMRWFTT